MASGAEATKRAGPLQRVSVGVCAMLRCASQWWWGVALVLAWVTELAHAQSTEEPCGAGQAEPCAEYDRKFDASCMSIHASVCNGSTVHARVSLCVTHTRALLVRHGSLCRSCMRRRWCHCMQRLRRADSRVLCICSG